MMLCPRFRPEPTSGRPRRPVLRTSITLLALSLAAPLLAARSQPGVEGERESADTRALRLESLLSLAEGLRGSALSRALARADGRERDQISDSRSAIELYHFVDRELEQRAIEHGRQRLAAERSGTQSEVPAPERGSWLPVRGGNPGFGQISIQQNAWIDSADGRHPAVAAVFFRALPGVPPVVTRAVFPVVGQSFTVRDPEAGRSYGSRLHIGLGDVIVDVLENGEWRRIEAEPEAPPPRTRRLSTGLCDASCPGDDRPFSPSLLGQSRP